ncbi:MAG: molybdenum ABC transporter ATP-binding protein [Kiritimatiellae bacterium]|nr:molybdenum ABC transporter ATP-binding protein [Kiritimatiellia bacterium]
MRNENTTLKTHIRLQLDRFDLDVNFEASEHVTGIFGVSGSGKTSLLETIAGLRQKAKGTLQLGKTIWFDSENGIFKKPEHRDIGFVPQAGLLFPHKNVKANLLAGGIRAKRKGQTLTDIFDHVIYILNLESLLLRSIDTLSGGERQRVALGRALCSGPRLLLMDEPLASLDVGMRHKVLPFLRRVRNEFDVKMLLVSHSPIEVQTLCDDLIVLQEGKIIRRGEPRTVLTDPAVFPLAQHQGFENILSCLLVDRGPHTNIIRLGKEGPPIHITTPKINSKRNETFLISIPAHDIIIATQNPAGLSARNILQAKIQSIQTVGNMRLITARLANDVPDLVIEVTADACEELKLEQGKSVYLIIKAVSCTLYENERED